jgi:tetratricopeptide (TPR) repeat protein
MTWPRLAVCAVLFLGFTQPALHAGKDGGKEEQPLPKGKGESPAASAQKSSPQTDPPSAADKLPLSRLAPAKLIPNLCVLKYPITTAAPECQAFFDQGLGYLYSYVWMEAARSFETAARLDPDCAMAWWGLSRALEAWQRVPDSNKALQKAHELKDRVSHREQQLILARMQQRGLAPGVGNQEERRKAAVKTIDGLLALYEDDEEAWFQRGQLATNGALFGGSVASAPFYKALLRYNPLHPGANHELVHYYESSRRPALGVPHAERYLQSSPGIPHAFHMQAHLAMRVGRWDKTTDRSAHAIELERAYHKEMNVRPGEDHQFAHHLETLLRSLIHDGRFLEARQIKQEARSHNIQHWLHWFRLHLAERNWDDAQEVVDHFRRRDKNKLTASYLAALLYLRKNEAERAAPEVEVLQHAYERGRGERQLQLRLWEVQGLLMCRRGAVEGGLKLLARAVERTKDEYQHHAWGGGAYYMEVWGTAALQCGKPAVAEEAFLEALAHDPGSVKGALGMQVLCERQGRGEEAERFAELARRCWRRAEVQSLQAELAALREVHVPNSAAEDRTPADAGGRTTP